MAKLGIVGAGHVGEIVAYTAALRGGFREIALCDVDEKRLDGVVSDLEDATRFYPHNIDFFAADYKQIADADIIVIASGRIPENAQRRDEFKNNHEDVAHYVPEIVKNGFTGVFVVVTNPCDSIAYHVWKYSGFDKCRIIGSGTALDSERARTMLARILGVAPDSVACMMLGEHGDSQFLPYSRVRIHHMALDEYLKKHYMELDKAEFEESVIYRGHRAFFGKGSTQYGIANTVNDILDAVLYDEKRTLQVSALHQGEYGVDDVFISTPCVVGTAGIEEVVELTLTEEELARYRESAETIRKYRVEA